MSNNKISFDLENMSISGTSIKIDMEPEVYSNLSNLFSDINQEHEYCEIKETLNVADTNNYIFLDEFFILKTSKDFKLFLEKIINKTTNKNELYHVYNYEENIFDDVELLKLIDVVDYSNVLQANNISLENIEKENVYIPPKLFNLWRKQIENHITIDPVFKEIIRSLKYLEELFSLIYIADTTTFKQNEFHFVIHGVDDKKVTKDIEWGKWEELQETNYFHIYNWENNKKSEHINNSILLNIVRNYFLNKKNLNSDNSYQKNLNSLLNIVIKGDVATYYEQKNKLKEEVLNIDKMISESKRDILKNLLGLIISIGIGFYGVIFDKKDFSFSSINIPLMWLFRFMIIAVIFFGFTFFLSINEAKKFYDNIKSIYTNHLLLDESDFKSMIKRPIFLSRDNVFYLLILLFFFIILIFLENNFRYGPDGWVNHFKIFFILIKVVLTGEFS